MNTTELKQAIAEYENDECIDDLIGALKDALSNAEATAERELEELPSYQEVMRKQHGLTREQMGIK